MGVGRLEIPEDGCPGWVNSTDLASAVYGCEWIVLIEVDRCANVGRNAAVVNTDAIDLNCQQDGYAGCLEFTSRCDGGSAAPALAEQNHASVCPLFGIKLSIAVYVESVSNQFERNGAMVIGDGFGVDAGAPAQPQDQLANAAVFVIPAIVSTEEADDEGCARRE